MRKGHIVLLFFFVSLVLTRCEDSRAHVIPDHPKNPDAEKLAKAIVVAISTDNYPAFTDIFVTQQEFVGLLQSSTNPRVQQRATDTLNMMRMLHKRARRSFDEIRKEGTRDGLAWERVKYKSTTYDIDTLDGVELIFMTIRMDFRGVEYALTAHEIVRTKSGWKLSGKLEYGDRLKNSYAVDLARKLQDSIHIADSIMAVYMYLQADSALKSDSIHAARERRSKDSIRIADSIAAASRIKKKKK